MIYPATLILAALVFNAASVLGAPIRVATHQLAVRAIVDEPIARAVEFETVVPNARELASENAIRDTASLPEIDEIVRRFPRRGLQERYEKRSQPEARDEAPEAVEVERRFPRRALYERAELEKRQEPSPVPSPVPSAPALPADVNTLVKTLADSGDEFQSGQTKKKTTVIIHEVEYKSKGEAGNAAPVVPPVPSVSATTIISSESAPTPTVPAIPVASSSAEATPTVSATSVVESAASATVAPTPTVATQATETPAVTPVSVPVVEPSVASAPAPEPTVTETSTSEKATETAAVPTTIATGEAASTTATATAVAGEGASTETTEGGAPARRELEPESSIFRRNLGFSGSVWASYLMNAN